MNLNTFEKEAILWIANELETEASAIETALGPVNTDVAGDIVTFANEVATKYTGPLAPMLEALIAEYKGQLPTLMAKEEGYGISDLVAYLKKLAGSTSG